VVDWDVAHAWLHTAGPKSVARTIGRATVLQSVPISYHFHGCTALLVLHFVVVNWCYIKYKAFTFTMAAVSERFVSGYSPRLSFPLFLASFPSCLWCCSIV